MVGGVSTEPELTLSPEIRGRGKRGAERYNIRSREIQLDLIYPLKKSGLPFIQLGIIRQSYLFLCWGVFSYFIIKYYYELLFLNAPIFI